jgi:hypothetical protein
MQVGAYTRTDRRCGVETNRLLVKIYFLKQGDFDTPFAIAQSYSTTVDN